MKFNTYNPNELINNLKRKGEVFSVRQTLFTKKIKCKHGEFTHYEKSSSIPQKYLGFIASVKNYVLKNVPFFNLEVKPTYIKQNNKFKKNITYKRDLWEIDLKGAYWEAAYHKNYISTEIYKKGLQVPKKVRLIALGNLAKRIAILNFNGKKYQKIFFEESNDTKNVFFDVSLETDKKMKTLSVIAGNNFLFYWVDAIFVKSEKTKNEIVQYLQHIEAKHHVIKLNSFKKKFNKIIVSDDEHKKPRVFYFEKKTNLLTKIKANEQKKAKPL